MMYLESICIHFEVHLDLENLYIAQLLFVLFWFNSKLCEDILLIGTYNILSLKLCLDRCFHYVIQLKK